MLLQFELDGQSCEAGAYTFRLDHAINFKQLKLRAVSIQCGNDKLAQTWSYTTTNVAYDGSEANRQLTSPLYLDLTGVVGESSVAHYLPTVHPHGSERTHVTAAGVVDISHAMPASGTTAEQGKYRAFDYTLINSSTPVHWPAGKDLTFALKHRSVEVPGQYSFGLQALDNTSFDNTCRVCITLETDAPSHQPSIGATTQSVPLYSGDNGDGADPTLSWNDLDGPVERGGTDTHVGAYLFAYTTGDNTGIQRLHVGPYTCAAGKELALVRVLNATGSPGTPGLHRTGLTSIADVDAYIRTRRGGTGTYGYGSLSYTKSGDPQGGDFDNVSNYHYVIAVTPLAGGGGQ
jgi:hypothetical protein